VSEEKARRSRSRTTFSARNSISLISICVRLAICSVRRYCGAAARDADKIWMAVANFSDFPADDPYAEHDLGAIDMAGMAEKIFWKIDYYADKSCMRGAEDPSDLARTFHVLTIMLASEW
jgi:uncharacterized protein DUF3768